MMVTKVKLIIVIICVAVINADSSKEEKDEGGSNSVSEAENTMKPPQKAPIGKPVHERNNGKDEEPEEEVKAESDHSAPKEKDIPKEKAEPSEEEAEHSGEDKIDEKRAKGRPSVRNRRAEVDSASKEFFDYNDTYVPEYVFSEKEYVDEVVEYTPNCPEGQEIIDLEMERLPEIDIVCFKMIIWSGLTNISRAGIKTHH